MFFGFSVYIYIKKKKKTSYPLVLDCHDPSGSRSFSRMVFLCSCSSSELVHRLFPLRENQGGGGGGGGGGQGCFGP